MSILYIYITREKLEMFSILIRPQRMNNRDDNSRRSITDQ